MVSVIGSGNLFSLPAWNARPAAAVKATGAARPPSPVAPAPKVKKPLVPMVDVGRRAAETELQNIDSAVRAHERAHLAAIGGNAQGSVQYDYVIGPGGRRYAVGGSISVNLQPVPGDPEATIRKAQAILRSAYAPGAPSGPDLRVAAAAYRMEMQAERELEKQKAAEAEGKERLNLFA